MRIVALTILAATLGGCRFAVIPMPDGKVAYAGSILTEPHFNKVEFRKDGTFSLSGYSSSVDVEAINAIATGVASGVLKAAKP